MRGEKVPVKLRLQHAAFDKVVFRKIREKLGLDQLRYSLSGAAPISADLLIFFKAIGIEILEVYGMTESTAVITANRPGRVRIGTVGEPVPGTEVKLAADGEVLARGPHITPGYWRRDEATAEAIDRDGWLHTGDLGRLEDGYLTIVGRKKELIVTAGGKNLSPNNIEETIKQRSIIIGQLCAVGDDRPFISALVVLDAEMLPLWCYQNDVTFASIEAAASEPKVLAEVQRAVDEGNATLARVEQVRRWAIIPNEWTAESEELTPSLKLKRSVIHDRYAATHRRAVHGQLSDDRRHQDRAALQALPVRDAGAGRPRPRGRGRRGVRLPRSERGRQVHRDPGPARSAAAHLRPRGGPRCGAAGRRTAAAVAHRLPAR